MKTLYCFMLVLLTTTSLKAQQDWVQTQINPGIGYSLTTTDSIIYASTYDGIYSTTSDGMPWFSAGLANHAVYDIISTGKSILAATAEGIYRSDDNGNSWTSASDTIICSGTGATQGNKVFAKNGQSVFIHTWAQGVFRSDDDGKTWQLLNVGTEQGLSGDLGGWATCIFEHNGRIFIGAPGGNIGIYYTADNGNSWQKADAPEKMANESILFFHSTEDTLYAGGFMGLYRSIDNGLNWTPLYRNTVSAGVGTFRSLVTYNKLLIAAIDFKSIQISDDGGQSWIDFNDGLISDWTFAALTIRSPYIWALSSFPGNIYRRSLTDIITNVKHLISSENNSACLEQNFPNPVKDCSIIKYTLKSTEKTELSVLDIHGKVIMTLVNDIQSPGTYEVQINASSLESGTYFYQLNTGNNSLTKKFTVTKLL